MHALLIDKFTCIENVIKDCISITMQMLLHEFCDVHVMFDMQIPLYPVSIFPSESDGEGMNVVLYFKLSEKYFKDLPDQFRENISVRGPMLVSLLYHSASIFKE